MSEDDAIIQAVAKDLWPFIAPRILPDSRGVPWRHIEPGTVVHIQAMDVARSAVAAYLGSLEAAGWAVVRKEPDEHQIDEASLKAGIGETSAKEVYAVMTAASPKPPGLGD